MRECIHLVDLGSSTALYLWNFNHLYFHAGNLNDSISCQSLWNFDRLLDVSYSQRFHDLFMCLELYSRQLFWSCVNQSLCW